MHFKAVHISNNYCLAYKMAIPLPKPLMLYIVNILHCITTLKIIDGNTTPSLNIYTTPSQTPSVQHNKLQGATLLHQQNKTHTQQGYPEIINSN